MPRHFVQCMPHKQLLAVSPPKPFYSLYHTVYPIALDFMLQQTSQIIITTINLSSYFLMTGKKQWQKSGICHQISYLKLPFLTSTLKILNCLDNIV